MENDINNLDPNDEGLKNIFGDRFHDATIEAPADTEKKPTRKAVDAKWEPAKPDPNWFSCLKACVKHAAIFGGLSLLVFYWQQAGLMAESIAVPCIAVCTALAGFGVGRNAFKHK